MMEPNSEPWRLLQANMTSLGRMLDLLTVKALELLTLTPPAPSLYRQLQAEMTAMRIEARQLVKLIRTTVQEIKDRA